MMALPSQNGGGDVTNCTRAIHRLGAIIALAESISIDVESCPADVVKEMRATVLRSSQLAEVIVEFATDALDDLDRLLITPPVPASRG